MMAKSNFERPVAENAIIVVTGKGMQWWSANRRYKHMTKEEVLNNIIEFATERREQEVGGQLLNLVKAKDVEVTFK